MSRRRPARRVASVCFAAVLVLSLGAVAFTAAPAAHGSGTAIAEEHDNGLGGDGNTSSNGSENESDGGGFLDGVSNPDLIGNMQEAFENAIPSTEEFLEKSWEWLIEKLRETMAALIDDIVNELLGTPTIENDGAFNILGTPVSPDAPSYRGETGEGFSGEIYSDLYHSVYLPYVMPLVGSVLTLMALSVLVGPALSAFTKRRMFSVIGTAAIAVFLVVGSWEFAALMHALSDGVTQHFLPAGEEVTSSIQTSAAGPIAAILGLTLASGTTAIALVLMLSVRQILLFFFPIVLPVLLVLAYWGGHRRVKQVGSFFIWQWYGLLVWTWPTAILLRAAYELDWTFHGSELVNFAMTMGVFLVALGLPIIISGAFGVIGMSMRGVAVTAAGTALGNVKSRAPNRGSGTGDPNGSGSSRPRKAGRRIWSGAHRAGISAKNRAAGAAARGRSRLSRLRNRAAESGDSQSTPGLPARSRPALPPAPDSRAGTAKADGGVRGRSMDTNITPEERRQTSRKPGGGDAETAFEFPKAPDRPKENTTTETDS